MPAKFELIAPCFFGCEATAKFELTRIGAENIRVGDGRLTFAGGPEMIAAANLNLRTVERVMLLLNTYPASTFDELFDGVYSIPWEELLPADAAFPVTGSSLNSQLTSVPACQSIIKKAVVKRLMNKHHTSVLPETGAEYKIRFMLRKNVCEIMLDTTGEGLHKRGYRRNAMEAPIRETLAATIADLGRVRRDSLVEDPFCGSGTIPIEAALIAKNRAPGLDRRFAAQKWQSLPAKLWLDAAEEAMDQEFHGQYDIWGGDIDPSAVELSRHNAELAGVDDCVRFEVADAGKFHRDSDYGQLVTNPPYGERLLEKREAEALYRSFGKAARTLPAGWRVLVLSSHTEFERAFGRSAEKNASSTTACSMRRLLLPRRRKDRARQRLKTGEIAADSPHLSSLHSYLIFRQGGPVMRHVFLINPHAGKQDQTARIRALADRLAAAHNLDCRCLLTDRPGGAEVLSRALAETGEPVRIYACGGDGTVHEAANGIAGFPNAAMTVIPAGTGNDF